MNRWLALAHKLSFDSCHRREQMAAVIVRGGAVLSLASNHSKRYGHAEARALSRAKDVEGATVYVMRKNKLTSKPCPNCRQLLIEAGIAKAVYVNVDGHVEIERLR